ncbi:MAG: ABC transporter substrate-binding protein [Alphaproteobacteria bacterium]|nr:ABC transporter substrate-binding protein [Alphaproteobacteria bacterium]
MPREPVTSVRISRLISCLVAACLLGAATCAQGADLPKRVVSLNLCLDQLVLAMAAPGQLVGVSDLSHDPRISPRWREARALPPVRKRAEEILALRPDLLIIDDLITPSLRKTLRLAGVPTLELSEAGNVEATLDHIARIGEALGRPEAARDLAASLRESIARLTRSVGPTSPVAAIYQANGMTLGRGTNADGLLRIAGWRNLAAERGLSLFVPIAMEELVLAAPDLLILDGKTSDRPSLAEQMMTHRAARRAFAGARTLVMPHSLWLCGGPQNLEALRRLTAARETLKR